MTDHPLSWPPPGLERLQGRAWRVVGLSWCASLVLVLPLLWALAVEQPFYSLGLFGESWGIGLALAAVGAVLALIAFADLLGLLRAAAMATALGYGEGTLVQVACDVGRDTGFLLQGLRHFEDLDRDRRRGLVRARLAGMMLLLGAALWLVAGFGLSILLAARGFLTASGVWLLTAGPSALALTAGLVMLANQGLTVTAARSRKAQDAGEERLRAEASGWIERRESTTDLASGPGLRSGGNRFRTAAIVAVVMFALGVVPIATVAVSTTLGPILAQVAVPTFLSVQEMAGATEALRGSADMERDPSITPEAAGAALQSLAFVGSTAPPDAMERAPARVYPTGWFPDPEAFPDPFSETVARELMRTPLDAFPPSIQATLRQAAAHPAHAEFALLARAGLVDIAAGRWTLPFPDSLTFQDLPWPRFQAYRTAALAQVAKASVELSDGRTDDARATLDELTATGFLLIDQGPTLLDNLVGVVLVTMAADALEEYHTRVRDLQAARALAWARTSAGEAARRARAGVTAEDIHSLLQGVPALVETDEALRGLRWEYFATFNTLAPCINPYKMIFGQDDPYDRWRERARDALVRVPGERALFDLAENGASGLRNRQVEGFLPKVLSLTLGRGGTPGSCAALIASMRSGS